MSTDADKFLDPSSDLGPQVPAARWGKIGSGTTARCVAGAVEKGVITYISDPYQQRKYVPGGGELGEPMFWNKPGTKEPDPDKPMMQLKVVIQTDHRDFDDDDGQRAIFVKGGLRAKIIAAIKEAKAPGLREGGWLAIKCTGMEPSKSGYDSYTWEVKYAPPPPASDNFTAGGDDMTPPEPTQAQKVEAKVAERRSTLDAIRNSGHQDSLRNDPRVGFDDEPPF